MMETQEFSSASLFIDKSALKGYLYEIFADLTIRYSSPLNLRTFQIYMGLPMFIGEKIFKALDTGCKNQLEREQFSQGLYDLYEGNHIRKIELVFDVLDFDKDGVICKEDTRLLLSHFHMIRGSQGLQTLEEIIEETFAENSSIQRAQFPLFSEIYFLFLSFANEYKPFHVGSVNYYKELNCMRTFYTSSKNFLDVPKQENIKSLFNSAPTNVNVLNISQESMLSEPSSKMKNYLKEMLNQTLQSSTKSDEKDDSIIKDLKILDEFELDKHTALLVSDKEILGTVPKYPSRQLQISSNKKRSSKRFLSEKISTAASKNKVDTTEYVERHGAIKNSSYSSSNSMQLYDSSSVLNSKSRKSSNVSESPQVNTCNTDSQTIFEIIVQIQDCRDSTQLSKNKFTLVNDDIFWFKISKNVWALHKIIHIRASFFDKCEPVVIRGKTYYPFQICIDFCSRSCPPLDVFCKDQKEMLDFVSKCKSSTKSRRISSVYELKEEIGKGHFASVMLGRNRLTKEKVAVKILCKSEIKKESIPMVMSEIDIFKFLLNASHENIVKALDFFETSSMIYFVYEYLPGGNLKKYLFTMSEVLTPPNKLVELIVQIGAAVKYLHHFGILHRDIKPDNILISCTLDKSIQLKVIDFGLSKVMGLNDMTNEPYGSLCYTAPEILLNHNYNHKVDVWSFGIIAYYLSFTALPFDDSSNNLREIRNKIINRKENYDHPLKYSCKFEMEIKQIISFCLQKDPQKRISMLDVMNHIMGIQIP